MSPGANPAGQAGVSRGHGRWRGSGAQQRRLTVPPQPDSSLHAAGQSIGSISTPVYYDAASQIDGKATSTSAPVQWGGTSSCVYYVTITTLDTSC